MSKRIAFVGAGAIGGYIGASLTALGHDITLIDPWPAHVEAMRSHGMHLYGMTEPENRIIQVNAMHITEVQQLAKQRPIDVAFIAVKSYDTVWATRMIRQYLAPGGFVVSSQNCVNEERIAGVVGWGRTVGCVVGGGVGVELFEPGHVRRTMMKNPNVMSFHVGEPHGRITKRAEELAEMLNGVDNADATDNLWGERWTKLCVNGMRNGVSAATGMGGNARDSHDAIRRVCIRLGGESVRVGQAQGFTLGKIGTLDPEKLALASEGNRGALEEIEALMLAGTNAAARSDLQRPSMAQDMAKGRRTEIEFMNGYIAEKGAEVGVPAPTHAMLTDVVKRVERGEIAADPANVLVNT
jgi:2-dehydropantoate 2-reductase